MMEWLQHHLPMIPFRDIKGDMIPFIEGGEEVHYHVLSYSWNEGVPMMILLPMVLRRGTLMGEGEPFPFRLTDIEDVSFGFSGVPYCTGRMVEGDFLPCPGSRPAERGFSQCMECLLQDIPDPACIFEPHCNRGSCGAHFCQVPHVVYVTAFRDRMKIGMTQFRRMKERAMEQGADGMLPLLLLKDRYSARFFEGRISNALGLPQVIRSNVKFPNLTKKRDLSSISGMLEGIREDLRMLWGDVASGYDPDAVVLKGPGAFDEKPIMIDDYPLREPLPSKPKRFKGERVMGKVIGYKGSYMFYRQGSIWAFRLSEVPGKVLSVDNDLEP